MSILGGGSNAGSLFIPNGLSLHIDAEALNAGEEEERRKEEEKQKEQLRQLICEELSKRERWKRADCTMVRLRLESWDGLLISLLTSFPLHVLLAL